MNIAPALAAGDKLGLLSLVAPTERNKRGQEFWACCCDCGQSVTRRADKLRAAKRPACDRCRFLKPSRPLSDAAQELAAHWTPWALLRCRPWKRRWPHLAADIESATLYSLTVAARDYDPGRGGFETWAIFNLNHALRREIVRFRHWDVIEILRGLGYAKP